jgi:hypothetical protein
MYPVVDGISEFHKPLTSEQVDNIQSNVTEEVFGDVVVRIGTNTIARDYDAILHQMLKTITDNVKEN